MFFLETVKKRFPWKQFPKNGNSKKQYPQNGVPNMYFPKNGFLKYGFQKYVSSSKKESMWLFMFWGSLGKLP